mmetsp:Transcript_29641/g.49147  ORF Transcript_29641/g.49147 Transcript_29641/m.49147 type:complete len:142 (+) Transcript_29641:1454-1879(+)
MLLCLELLVLVTKVANSLAVTMTTKCVSHNTLLALRHPSVAVGEAVEVDCVERLVQPSRKGTTRGWEMTRWAGLLTGEVSVISVVDNCKEKHAKQEIILVSTNLIIMNWAMKNSHICITGKHLCRTVYSTVPSCLQSDLKR